MHLVDCVLIFYCSLFLCVFVCFLVCFFKQKTAYEMRISDWSSDVCSSDLAACCHPVHPVRDVRGADRRVAAGIAERPLSPDRPHHPDRACREERHPDRRIRLATGTGRMDRLRRRDRSRRSEEHTSELQSLMRISYAVFCLKKKIRNIYSKKENKHN